MSLVQMDFSSVCLNRYTTMEVFLPDGPMPENGFRSLYFLHGYLGNHADLLRRLNLLNLAEKNNIAIFMPDGDNAYWADFPERAEFYQEYVARELVPMTRRLFHLSHRRDDTYVAGISMGGGGAIRLGFSYSEVFGKVVSLSGYLVEDEAFDPVGHGTNVLKALDDVMMARAASMFSFSFSGLVDLPKLYLTIGTEDVLLESNRHLHEALEMYGISHIYREYPGEHTWDFWNAQLPDVFAFLDQREGGDD